MTMLPMNTEADDHEPASPVMSTTQATLLSHLRDAGDHASWQRFFDIYWRMLYSIGRRSGLSDAEAKDVVQEAIIDVSKQMPGFKYDRARGSFKSWLAVIMRRRIVESPGAKAVLMLGLFRGTEMICSASKPSGIFFQ